MPARIVDGDALWRSDKLAKVDPPRFRAEYANLIPLALADGTFECNPRRVWSDVYSYNRPDVTQDMVAKMLNEFERVGLLTRKTDGDGKTWGFWVGIEKRLPSESTRARYRQGNSNVFNGSYEKLMSPSRQTHDDIVPGLDIDRKGLDERTNRGQGEFKNLAIRYRRAFGVRLGHDSMQKSQFAEACQQHGEDAVLKYFDEWSQINQWIREKAEAGQLKSSGLRQFYETLPEMIEEDRVTPKVETIHGDIAAQVAIGEASAAQEHQKFLEREAQTEAADREADERAAAIAANPDTLFGA